MRRARLVFAPLKDTRRDFLSAYLRPITASLLHSEAGNSPTGSVRRLGGWLCTENRPADGFCLRAWDLETRARSGSREEAPRPPCSDPENGTYGRAACQLAGRLASSHTGARRD